jgi:hypothetical protein
MQITGHKNVSSITSYGEASIDQQQDMSKMLSTSSHSGETAVHPLTTDVNNDFAVNDIDDILKLIETAEGRDTISITNSTDRQLNMKSSTASTGNYILSGSRIQGNVTINMNCSVYEPSAKRKRIRVMIDSDSE